MYQQMSNHMMMRLYGHSLSIASAHKYWLLDNMVRVSTLVLFWLLMRMPLVRYL